MDLAQEMADAHDGADGPILLDIKGHAHVFFSSAGDGVIDSAFRIDGVRSSQLTIDDFQAVPAEAPEDPEYDGLELTGTGHLFGGELRDLIISTGGPTLIAGGPGQDFLRGSAIGEGQETFAFFGDDALFVVDDDGNYRIEQIDNFDSLDKLAFAFGGDHTQSQFASWDYGFVNLGEQDNIADALAAIDSVASSTIYMFDVDGDGYLAYTAGFDNDPLDSLVRLRNFSVDQLTEDNFVLPPVLSGTDGDDVLESEGNSRIVGGAGRDELYGTAPGMDRETFLFYEGDAANTLDGIAFEEIFNFDALDQIFIAAGSEGHTSLVNSNNAVFVYNPETFDAVQQIIDTLGDGFGPSIWLFSIGSDAYIAYNDTLADNVINSVIMVHDYDAVALQYNIAYFS